MLAADNGEAEATFGPAAINWWISPEASTPDVLPDLLIDHTWGMQFFKFFVEVFAWSRNLVLLQT